MQKISRIHINGFRRLEKFDLRLKALNVLVGANGVGKSSLLDAFSLLSASASLKLNDALSGLGGVANLLTRDRAKELSVEVDMDVPGHNPLQYDLQIATRGTGYSIAREVLCQTHPGHANAFKHIDSAADDIRYYEPGKKKLLRPEWEHNPLETSLAQVPRMFREPEEMRRILSSAAQYHVLDVGTRAPVKLPQQMKPAASPGSSGEDLVPFLYYLREGNSDRFQLISDTIRAAFPKFESLSFPPVAAGMLTMTWKESSFTKPLYINELSEGTLRFLWLVSLLQCPDLPTITMIDEPEVSLHPEMLSLLAELMREAARRTQLVVATHSDRLVRFLSPEEVVVMDAEENGSTQATWADSLELDSWLSEYSLDDIWRMGRLGGRP